MSIIRSVLMDELDRNHRAQQAYHKELSQYPKGSLIVKNRRAIAYFYLAYRNSENKIKTEYIGNANNPKVNEVRLLIQKRKEIKQIIKDFEKDEVTLRKMLARGWLKGV